VFCWGEAQIARSRIEPFGAVAAGKGFDISRENVVGCILEALRQPLPANRVVDLLDGETPIAHAFAEV